MKSIRVLFAVFVLSALIAGCGGGSSSSGGGTATVAGLWRALILFPESACPRSSFGSPLAVTVTMALSQSGKDLTGNYTARGSCKTSAETVTGKISGTVSGKTVSLRDDDGAVYALKYTRGSDTEILSGEVTDSGLTESAIFLRPSN